MITPTVSIILATYNRAEYILESLYSIQQQTFTDWECLIIDDGGSDNTQEILAPILKQDTRFQYFMRTPKYQKGLPGSRNYGLDLAKGDYIIFFDDDDIAHPQNLELCVAELSNAELSFCRYIRDVFRGNFVYDFDYSKEYTSFHIDSSDINKILRNELQFNSCAVMWTKECYTRHRYIEHLKYAEEWEVYARIITSVNRGISINKTLYYGRKHDVSITGDFGNRNLNSLSSYTDAIQLVIANLKEKKMLSSEILRYFIQVSLQYKEFNLFERIINTLDLPKIEELKWRLFYIHLPFRLFFYGIWLKVKKL
ncbi:glycosyltransferase family 2 protein [Flavobacterium turcicum]|uniref:Glycosyltransferase family 2 protein n=1 Tax=Flavobacterium turcicum TaxID=2764718 RepID=A0ABR7JGP1_9FLAO|nr:glycosyltransferase family 2 protein [Flavobacterium turcicum]MBC5863647.1 glycosyltransferase family 2 protein [Flavobacterium turcicum]NHL02403.1 glycosyltransferase family 2 protein [Flavobacterium turcicum]